MSAQRTLEEVIATLEINLLELNNILTDLKGL